MVNSMLNDVCEALSRNLRHNELPSTPGPLQHAVVKAVQGIIWRAGAVTFPIWTFRLIIANVHTPTMTNEVSRFYIRTRSIPNLTFLKL